MDNKPSLLRATRGIAVAFAALLSTTFLQAAQAAADAADQPAYRKTIEEGLAEYDAHHFEEARSLFRRAHEIGPNARTFRGMGMTSFELRDYVSAVHNLSAALQDRRKALSAEQRKQTQDLLDRSRMFVDVYTLTVSPASARVLVDGRAPEFEPDGTLMFGFGTHTLEASAQGMVARSLSINVRGGERKELSVTLEPVLAVTARPVDTGSVQVRTTPRPASVVVSNAGAEAWLWASGGAALLAVGAGIYLYNQNSQLNSCRHPTAGWRCTNESAIKTREYIAIGATAGLGAAAVTMALIGIFSWDSGPPASKDHSALNLTVSPFGVTCAGSF